MNDLKNVSLALASTVTSVCTAIEARTVITIISAVVLPIVFFAVGKTVDVYVQLRMRRAEIDAGRREAQGAKQ